MNKSELIASIAEKSDVSKAVSEKTLNAFIDSVTGELKNGGQVSLVGFGTFSVVKRTARKGRNPKTGAELQIAASNQPKFKAGKALKDSVN